MNQEINRVASLYTFWPKDIADEAIGRYLSENRKNAELSPLDRRIILTLAQNLKRDWQLKGEIRDSLVRHLQYFPNSIRTAWEI